MLAPGERTQNERHSRRAETIDNKLSKLSNSFILPQGTNSMDLYKKGIDLATNPKHTRWLSPLLLVADAVLCALIIWKIPCEQASEARLARPLRVFSDNVLNLLLTIGIPDTEIDWKAYMQQIAQYRGGERDYTLIKGDTGPLVYPAAHVYIYNILYLVTNEGIDIFRAQCIFMIVYLAALSMVLSCYRMAKVPPYIFPLLILSKRLHSIFLLRLFNDCFAVLALFTTIHFYQRKVFTIGSVAYSFGVGTKMSLLLAAPAIGVILMQVLPFRRAMNAIFLMAQVQFTLAVPFLKNFRGYLTRAFELSRVFMYKWTVNWRFVGEERFLSRDFAVALLIIHLTLLATFIWTRWIRPSGLSVPALISTAFNPLPVEAQQQIYLNTTPSSIMTAILTSMAIGILCARSLHYQFYAYVAWSTPFLLWKSGAHPVLTYAVWAAQEWAWNVYPSTETSSKVVVGCLAVQVLALWQGTKDDFLDKIAPESVGENENGDLS